MKQTTKYNADPDPLACLAGGGDMGALMRSLDWSKTPLGPVESWSPTLRTTVRTLLVNRFPLLLWWGPQYVQLYNDAYRPIPGAKHPKSMGQPARECWQEIWHIIGPLIDTPFQGGPATWMEDIFLEVNRHGFVEETHFTIAYSPVPDDTAPGGIGGVLGTVHEITEKVVGERRMVALRDLGSRPAEAKTAEEACTIAAKTLAAHEKDIPFALLYLTDVPSKQARLAGATGVPLEEGISPALVDLGASDGEGWPLALVMERENAIVVTDLGMRFRRVPPGPWSDPPNTAVVLPIHSTKAHEIAGFFIAGVSARLRLDDAYRGFLNLATNQIAAAIANARAYEEEKRRAEALVELDRAKTAFFSTVSHEFRTPLTLMLGPVEELLAKSHTDLSPAAAGQLEIVNRNGLRLLRLVNTLLDFSRIQAGRVRAMYEPTDLGAFTAELASVFRAAVERAGLRLVVDCPPLADPVFVDREMWEKIILNLLSNAFKFTFKGEIAVSLRQGEPGANAPGVPSVEVRVRDTGTGIPPEEMPRLFERFHRIQNARGRTHEGSGIGLALVQELVKLHGGSVAAESVLERGTTFIITIPLGSAHLPADQIGGNRTLASTATGAGPYVEEALRWLPSEEKDEGGRMKDEISEDVVGFSVHPSSSILHPSQDDRPRVLVADDNADMRQYVARLLAQHYQVEGVPDGEIALAAARQRLPDLVLTDVMMPRLDGFGLLRELRADPRTRDLPVIMLSARAGDESRVEGMEAGADDYLIKPFSARELLARIAAHLQMARLRREAGETLRRSEERFQSFMRHTPTTAYIKDEEGRYLFVNRTIEEMFGRPLAEWVGKTDFDIFPPQEAEQYRQNDRTVLAARTTAEYVETVTKEDSLHYYLSFKFPLQEVGGRCLLAGMSLDITDRKRAEEELARLTAASERQRRLYETILTSTPDLVYVFDLEHRFTYANQALLTMWGRTWHEAIGKNCLELGYEPWHAAMHDREIEQVKASKQPIRGEVPFTGTQGRCIYDYIFVPVIGANGEVEAVAGTTRDITERKQMEEELRNIAAELADANRRKDEFLAILAHELRNPLAPLRTGLQVMKLARNNSETVEQSRAMMERQLGQMVRLIDDLLDLSRISRGKITLQKERIELANVIQQAVETSRPLIDANGHDLAIQVPSQPIYVDGDPIRLAQVFANLLNNAAKFTARGGRITLTVQRQGSDAVVSVRDTGVGIPANMLPKLFEMFTQVDRSLERSQGGLGIGLSLVERLVEMHGGSVEAHSEGHGRGSEFVVRLPMVLSVAGRQRSEQALDKTATPARRRILVVDDNRDSALSLALMFQITGNETQIAHDGLEALEVAAAFRPDVVLLDIGMPKLNGYDTARRVRQEVWGKNVLLIALTGWGQEEDKRQSMEAGFNAHMVKPVEPASLEKLLAELQVGI